MLLFLLLQKCLLQRMHNFAKFVPFSAKSFLFYNIRIVDKLPKLFFQSFYILYLYVLQFKLGVMLTDFFHLPRQLFFVM